MAESDKPGNQLDQTPKSVIESASATTSPDNKSGAAPWVIVGVSLVVALLACGGVANLIGALWGFATAASQSGAHGYSYDRGSSNDLDDELDRLLEDYLGDSGSSSSGYSGAGHRGSTYDSSLTTGDAQVAPSVAACLGHVLDLPTQR